MATSPRKSVQLIPRDVIEHITIKKILLFYPEAITYKSLISFNHMEGKASLNLTLLPKDLAEKIRKLFS